MNEVYYRYEGSSNISLIVLKPIKETRCGVWLDYYGVKKFNLNDARKRFAYENQADAFKSFLKRKKKQLAIYKSRVRDIESILDDLKNPKIVEDLNKYHHHSVTKMILIGGDE